MSTEDGSHPADPLAEILGSLRLAAWQRQTSGRWALLGRAPAWLAVLRPGFPDGQPEMTPGISSTFLENFLVDARQWWEGGSGDSLSSGPWTETDPRGREHHLEATALMVQGAPVLLLEALGAEHESRAQLLQKAYESSFAYERLLKTQEALRESERFTRETLDALSQRICVLDEGGQIIAANQCWARFVLDGRPALPEALTGWSFRELAGVMGCVDPAARQAFLDGVQGVLGGQTAQARVEHSSAQPEGLRHYLVRMTRFRSAGNARVVIAWEDITESRRAEETLRNAHRELELRVEKRTAELRLSNALLEAHRQRLRAMSQRLLMVQESERRSVARELHDEVGQLLTALKLRLELGARGRGGTAATTFREAESLVAELLERVRQLTLDLRPPMLDDLGLRATLEWHFQRLAKMSGLQVHFDQQGLDERLPAELETAAFRIVQEALTNVARHAGVQEAWVELSRESSVLSLRIVDRGQGFEPDAALGRASSSGLSGMQERVDLLGGKFLVTSAHGRGATLQCRLPLPDREPGPDP